ncbi:phosphate-starvation-inducible protein PsiF [Chimaeribacter arupi]|uniref:Phosphate-starvation-inducible protein PsiF n=2 Tax=Yersiniaceae TaxID=1903411 RepID=A0A2N5EMD7_9GAMM|nr:MULTISPECIES: PsiF family protein [Yersiniaceae]MBS0969558.1 phosphate-starvation-inducible protein PsiF [Nissabacter archeti]PLR35251.1 phosphate-starvation-inducible protein PsiF [Chimaeribacter arupi]PLR44047.1 phosphate-starvation-inducible protein PsiF [Chimaeribacter arupi]PLR48953.1 phosphate-starvation-inducible protein PsiF [Chimaeribacter arupi]WKZ91340.1 PsiF family protein [Chimaeribacter arupi]
MRIAFYGCAFALLFAGNALAAGHSSAVPSSVLRDPDQQKMTDCEQQATMQSLKGEDRKKFMSQCLPAQVNPAKELTPHQLKMQACNQDADKQDITGDARKTFMSQCLSRH